MGNKSKVVLSVLFAGVIVGGLGAVTKGFREWNPTNWFSKEDQSDIQTSVKSNGVSIKNLKTTANNDGKYTTTFTYEVSPSNATNKSVTVSIAYADGTDCSAVSTVSVSGVTKTVTVITEGNGFDKQIVIKLTSVANAEATARVTLDFGKKVLGYSCKDTVENTFYLWESGNDFDGVNPRTISALNTDSIVDPQYSAYTIDKDYTFAFLASADSCRFELLHLTRVDGDAYGDDFDNVLDEICEGALKTWVVNALKNGSSALTADEMWAMDSSNIWHSFLKECSNCAIEEGYFEYSCAPGVSGGGGTKTLPFKIRIPVGYNFENSKYSVNVDSITSESTTIEI